MCNQSAPAFYIRIHSSASFEKSLDNIEGAIIDFKVVYINFLVFIYIFYNLRYFLYLFSCNLTFLYFIHFFIKTLFLSLLHYFLLQH
jgi:hypothetical protein